MRGIAIEAGKIRLPLDWLRLVVTIAQTTAKLAY